jgi:hypothetical protein
MEATDRSSSSTATYWIAGCAGRDAFDERDQAPVERVRIHGVRKKALCCPVRAGSQAAAASRLSWNVFSFFVRMSLSC